MANKTDNLEALRFRLQVFKTEYGSGLAKWALQCCQLAFTALERGDYGVGAVLLNAQGERLAEGMNKVFSQGYNSAAHAEMNVIDAFEYQYPDYPDREGLTLIVSLEPCPMCTARILSAGIGHVVYLAEDKSGGMLSRCSKLPDAWRNLSQLLEVSKFSQAEELSTLAFDIANAQLSQKRKKLISIIRPERL